MAHAPRDARVLYRSAKVPGAMLVTLRGGGLLEDLPKLGGRGVLVGDQRGGGLLLDQRDVAG